ncbi:NAD(P)-dependent oxidoreductase [Dyella ginsengisoli]|uniref:NAD(P)-dependent oxidoreductase n=1 Tax=Dyella ginsengisoli TaxID=363848 RepID=A0ABW8JVA7_9GAMM
MADALIGYSGFVGSTLLKQAKFESLYRSTNIGDIREQSFDTVVCAGAPAQKWIANREPNADRQNIDGLIAHLDALHCKRFVLISTVDVFKRPIGVDERTAVDVEGNHPYGTNRRLLESFVESRFSNHLIVRLPGLVGPGLRKNVIFDLLNENKLEAIDSRSLFQFYPMVNLWHDIQIAISAKLSLVHLTAEPISVARISEQGFGKVFQHVLASSPAEYDMRTVHANIFGSSGSYQYSARETIQSVRAYAQSEPLRIQATGG